MFPLWFLHIAAFGAQPCKDMTVTVRYMRILVELILKPVTVRDTVP